MTERKNGRAHGEIFTATSVVQYILNEVGYLQGADLRNVSILEPSAGHGAFATEILKRLFVSSQAHSFSFVDALSSNVRFIELNPIVHAKLKSKLKKVLGSFGIEAGSVIESICINENFLETSAQKKYNCVVGDPPYIRYELISDKDKLFYKSKFGTFRQRADLYIPFFEHGLNLLDKQGSLCFICSNRWLYNQYGEQLRQLISKYYNLRRILNIERATPFDETVIAYPCITTVTNDSNGGTAYYYETDSKEIDFNQLNFEEIKSPDTSSWQNLFLNYDIDHSALLGLTEQGFKIGIGVATGADGIFVIKGDELQNIEKNRLLPLISARDLSKNRVNWQGQHVINPYENEKLCDLEKYPGLKAYLTENKHALLKRHIAQKCSEKWYQTIDKINPEIQNQVKILLPDLTGNKVIFIDEGDFYPHHSIYYITGKNLDTLKILACILMSDFIRSQLSQIGIRMNGGLPRFQSQVLRKIKVPNISLMEITDKENLMQAYDRFDFYTINCIIDSFCRNHQVQSKEPYDRQKKPAPVPLNLFSV